MTDSQPRKTILITRPREDATELATKIRDKNYEPLIEPMLEITALDFELSPVENFSGLIITSKNALRTIPDAILEQLTTLPVYCVGTATSALAADKGFSIIIDAGGDREDLERTLIASALPPGATLLYLSGADISGEIKNNTLDITRIPVYKAAPVAAFSESAIRTLQNKNAEAVLFMSVRTAENFCALARQYALMDSLQETKAICLSENIRKAVDKFTWKAILTARRPDQLSLLAEIE